MTETRKSGATLVFPASGRPARDAIVREFEVAGATDVTATHHPNDSGMATVGFTHPVTGGQDAHVIATKAAARLGATSFSLGKTVAAE